MTTQHRFSNILITGASRGLGRALALHYAAPDTTLWLSAAKNEQALEETAHICRERGANVNTQIIDVAQSHAMHKWVKECFETNPLNLIIANAGISGGTHSAERQDNRDVHPFENYEQTKQIFDVNLHGVLNTIHPAIEKILESHKDRERKPHIAIISSLAGFRGMPGAPAYCASKAALKSYGESLRGHLAPHNIGVSVICPGFIETDMTAVNPFPMPFMMSAEKAAMRIARDIEKEKGRIAFPFPMLASVRLLQILPDWLTHQLTRKTPSKPPVKEQ